MNHNLKIATPISHQFENEHFAKEIIAVSDCLEVRERSLDSQWPHQFLFHIDIDLTHTWNRKIKSYLQNAFKKKKDLSLVTFQATRCCKGKTIINGMFKLDGKVFSKQQMFNNAKNNVEWVKSVTSKKLKIGLENNNYYPTPAYDIVSDGDFISEVIHKNDLYLLLDIAHAMVTAHNKNIKYQDYLKSLPLDRLLQLHICQPYLPEDGVAYDTHNEPNDEMLSHVLTLINKYPTIEYLTIEYYKDKNIIINSINNLISLINSKK